MWIQEEENGHECTTDSDDSPEHCFDYLMYGKISFQVAEHIEIYVAKKMAVKYGVSVANAGVANNVG